MKNTFPNTLEHIENYGNLIRYHTVAADVINTQQSKDMRLQISIHSHFIKCKLSFLSNQGLRVFFLCVTHQNCQP